MRILCVALLLSVACNGQDHWLATVYPDKNELTTYVDFGEYTSLEKCRRAATSFLAFIGRAEGGDYECGKNCKPLNPRDPGLAPLMVCQVTER